MKTTSSQTRILNSRPLPITETLPANSTRALTLKGRRIVFVLGNLELGGAERQALMLARYLSAQEQATVEVWGFNTAGPVAKLCEDQGIRWRVVPHPFKANFLKRLISVAQIAWLLRRARPDILLPYTFVPNTVCGLVWKWTGAQLCVWNQRDEGIVVPRAWWERWAVKRTPQFVANSRAGASFLIDKLGVDRSKVRVIQNGIEALQPGLDHRAWRERLEIDEASFAACMIANLHANKDHETLLKAWRLVVSNFDQRGRSAVLVLAGRHYGAYESLVELTRELGIENSVRFTGQVSDVAGLLSAVDIGVFSSRSEGCPNGVLECMAAGLAVVATDIDGVREALGASGNQLLAPPGDAERFARLILKVAEDPTLRSTVGARNQKRIKEQYDSQRMCEDTASLLVSHRSTRMTAD